MNGSTRADSLGLAIVQMKPRKGDRRANLDTLSEAFAQLVPAPPDVVALPEGALTGYFLEGGVYDLAVDATTMAHELADAWQAAGGNTPLDVVCGFFENDGGTYYNSGIYAALDGRGGARVVHVHRKMFLPTYGVFDEERFLSRGRRLEAFATRWGTSALLICEDAWHAIMPTLAAIKGARVLYVPSASPGRGLGGDGELESVVRWRDLLVGHAVEHGIFVVYAGLAGFEGGKGMTGSSCVISPRGDVLVCAPALGSCIVRATLDLHEIDLARASLPLLGDLYAVLPDLLLDDQLPLPERRA